MCDAVKEFTVGELLADEQRYLIPMYQRNYAWGEVEITQLVQDIEDYQKKFVRTPSSNAKPQPYYIGTLVVFKRQDGRYEVIDGQQRFTTLTLLALCLKHQSISRPTADEKKTAIETSQPNLEFECRPNSVKTIAVLSSGRHPEQLRSGEFNESIVNGYTLLAEALSRLDNVQDFSEYLLQQVKISRVSVPEDTDLNHYFEVMNNRGEQLEKHEVLKAKLLSALNKAGQSHSGDVLNTVWNACANMNRYVQFGFTVEERNAVFGEKSWSGFQPRGFQELLNAFSTPGDAENANPSEALTLLEIISSGPALEEKKTKDSNNTESCASAEAGSERFKSVIDFPNFLLQVLSIWWVNHKPAGHDAAIVSLDDKRLVEQFETLLLAGENIAAQVESFIFTLLKCKHLLDQYVIKRDKTTGSDESGRWSLKSLNGNKSDAARYRDSFQTDAEAEDEPEGINRSLLMLQAAFEVSTSGSLYKHWLNGALQHLYNAAHAGKIAPEKYLNYMERLARHFVFDRLVKPKNDFSYADCIASASDTKNQLLAPEVSDLSAKLTYRQIPNNFVFNYLDYLIWDRNHKAIVKDSVITTFEFTNRSSVEHFYPQNAFGQSKNNNPAKLHSFGNLCLISRSENSRVSAYLPSLKKNHYENRTSGQKIPSLKLHEMLKTAENWGNAEIAVHETAMLNLLRGSTSSSASQDKLK